MFTLKYTEYCSVVEMNRFPSCQVLVMSYSVFSMFALVYITVAFYSIIPSRIVECESRKIAYRGHVSTTISGRTCQAWNAQTPHKHNVRGIMLPEKNLTNAKNYCRRPHHFFTIGQYCYTTDVKMRWEFCDIPMCKLGML